jgi:hypothetical protein
VFRQVAVPRAGKVAAYERTCARVVAPISLPESDTSSALRPSLSSLGYEQAARRRNPSRLVAHTCAGLGRRHCAIPTCLTMLGWFQGVLVTIMVTRPGRQP